MPGYFGKYRAYVRDNNDPRKIGRVKLHVPDPLGNLLTDWATPILPFPGEKNVGLFVRPKLNSRVWAEFEGGNENRPIYSGGWWAQDETPSLATGAGASDASLAGKGTDKTSLPFPIGSEPKQTVPEPPGDYGTAYGGGYVFRGSSGFVIEIDETPKKERLHVFHPSGTDIEIQADGRLVIKSAASVYAKTGGDVVEHVLGAALREVLKDQYELVHGAEAREIGGKLQILAKQGITLEDAQGNLVSLDPSTGKLTIQAFGNMDLKANGTITIDALNVNILGRSVTPVGGTPI